LKIIIFERLDGEGCAVQRLEIDGKVRLHVSALCECPEDAIIGRSLVSCADVAAYMREAYEAGKRGETFEIEKAEMKKD
jgi:hypothetical protein